MRRKVAIVYAVACAVALLAGLAIVIVFAWRAGIAQAVACVAGVLCSFVLAPAVHELGHVCAAKAEKMKCVYVKFFCFKWRVKGGKTRFSFASPFAADQTQVLPVCGGDMQRRAISYTLGGLIFSGVFLTIALVGALLCLLIGENSYFLWGSLPNLAYTFFLNLPPVEYVGGKTDALVYRGIKRGTDAEKCMLAAMEIHGRLFAGESFGEIEESLYFGLPQLPEDEPLYAVLLDLRYRYYLDIGRLDDAADCLNRLARSQEYLPYEEVEKLAAELVYMHAISGDVERAEECGKLCRAYLVTDCVTAKRILLAYSFARGDGERVALLYERARVALESEWILGVKKFEENLIERIK